MKAVFIALALAPLLVIAGAAQDSEWAGKLLDAQRSKDRGNYPEAVTSYREAAALANRFGRGDPRTWNSYNLLAIVYDEAGLPLDSIRTYREAMAMVKDAIGKQNSHYAMLLANLASVYLGLEETASAESMLREALHIETQLAQPDPIDIAMMQSRMAETLMVHRRFEDSERMIQSALPVLEGKQPFEVSINLNNLALLRRRQHRYEESIELFGRSIATVEKKLGPSHPLLLRPLNNLAVTYELAGQMDEADATFRRTQAICEKSLPPGHPSRAALLFNYAGFLRRVGEKKRAKAMKAEAQSLARDVVRREGLGMTVDASAFRQK